MLELTIRQSPERRQLPNEAQQCGRQLTVLEAYQINYPNDKHTHSLSSHPCNNTSLCTDLKLTSQRAQNSLVQMEE